MDTFVFAGGGSGGHLFPAIAVARELQKRSAGCRIAFIGGSRAIEGDILGRESFERRTLDASPSSELWRRPIRFGWRTWGATRSARRWLGELRPRAVVGCGGFVSVPVALAARRESTPLVLLEQNVVPRRATSRRAVRASSVCISVGATSSLLPRGTQVIFTGNPVREEIAALLGQRDQRSGGPPTLLVLGGSQGASSVNTMLLRYIERHSAELGTWRIVHQTGSRDESMVRARYAEMPVKAEAAAFLVDMAANYSEASVVVSRGGATTLAELACAGLPAVVIPYPGAIRDHQLRNAEVFASSGAAGLVTDGADDEFRATLRPLLTDCDRRNRMAERMRQLARPNAAQLVADAVLSAG